MYYLIAKNIYAAVEHTGKEIHFSGIKIDDILVFEHWIPCIDFLEIFQSYQKNFLVLDKLYEVYEIEFIVYKCKDDSIVYLSMQYNEKEYKFSKYDAAKIVHKLNRILARCNLMPKPEERHASSGY
ncbi:hypothetical protein [Candidatus Sulfurimonas baltica]|uniref:Uncharacterized protein n=1 Tax=Candidatus Sulfurimonas baltica TaxID=2740404 RepID=A0A7S7LXG6_9BACT|nr:hypothetical protein [Candidatus Sulfurimonas baltica]QOY53200.1 hypothetical protein HUE88_05845 [Candidatus Sulfurimonas baltica]